MALFNISLKTKYLLKTLITPSCWLRNSSIDKEWDTILWNLLESEPIEYVGSHEIFIGGYTVWCANEFYASGRILDYELDIDKLCSRKTALFLHDQIPGARIMQELRGPHDDWAVYLKTGFFL